MNGPQAIEHILDLMRRALPDNLIYHGVAHTIMVLEAAEKIARVEGLPEKETQLLKVAAAFHDCGFIISYKEHEARSCDIANAELPAFGFSGEEIAIINRMIMCTRLPQQPSTPSECILCDADLDYLGGDDYFRIATGLHEELLLNGAEMDDSKWLKVQIGFLESHTYWTQYARQILQPGKDAVLSELKTRLG